MAGGIIVFGANGSGKSTLAWELARALKIKHMDIEDYYFAKSDIPYTSARLYEDCVNLMLDDIRKYGSFVLSAVTGDFIYHGTYFLHPQTEAGPVRSTYGYR